MEGDLLPFADNESVKFAMKLAAIGAFAAFVIVAIKTLDDFDKRIAQAESTSYNAYRASAIMRKPCGCKDAKTDAEKIAKASAGLANPLAEYEESEPK